MRTSKKKKKIIFIIVTILFCVSFLLFIFGSKISPKFISIAELNIKRYLETIASEFKIYQNHSEEFLILNENEKKEIVYIDYNLKKIYEVSNEFTKTIQESVKDYNLIEELPYTNNIKDKGNNGILLSIPIGVVTNNVFLSNLGPKIPVYIHFIGSVFTQVKSRVTDYGINNALLEVYLKVILTYEVITPITEEEKTIEYELLIDSKVVQGIVPNWYGSSFETTSTFFEVPFP